MNAGRNEARVVKHCTGVASGQEIHERFPQYSAVNKCQHCRPRNENTPQIDVSVTYVESYVRVNGCQILPHLNKC